MKTVSTESQPSIGEIPITLIGGSGSSGSSLLARILDCHPDILCGPEMAFFNKRQVYGSHEKFSRNFRRWMRTGLPTDGYFFHPGFLRGLESYAVTETDIAQICEHTSTMEEVIRNLQEALLRRSGKSRFVEKTPSNAYCFKAFLDMFPDGKVVHMVRDGRDVVCSLIGRGMDLYEATSVWLYNTAAAAACRGLSQYAEIRYEDLVTEPGPTIEVLCRHLGVEFDERMLERKNAGDDRRKEFASWSSSPSKSPITDKSVGKFRHELTTNDLQRFYNVRLTRWSARMLGVERFDTRSLLTMFEYDLEGDCTGGYPVAKALDPVKDSWQRNWFLLRKGWGIRRPMTWAEFSPGNVPR